MNVHENPAQNSRIPTSSCCFFCAIKQPDPHLRRTTLTAFFTDMPNRDDPENVLVMSTIWTIAMNHPADPYLPSLGVLHCATALISRALADPAWLGRHQNVYIPYYALHILGSYTLRLPSLASLSVTAGAVPHLLALLRGSLSWVEQRVAVRALGHLVSFPNTFPAIADHTEEIILLAIRLTTSIKATVRRQFVSVPRRRRMRYHRDLLTRGLGGADMEVRRAEEWTSQTQCWSIHLLSSLAFRHQVSHAWICRHVSFLNDLGRMWGSQINGSTAPAAAGLLRILCRSNVGRREVAGCVEVVENLCSLSRSPDECQYMGIDCLLLLLDDPITRHKVLPIAAQCLVDLSELWSLGPRRRLGDTIANCLLWDYDITHNESVRSMWEEKKIRVRKSAEVAMARKLEGNKRFWAGDVVEAVERYTVALRLCPLEQRQERAILYSNRTQCWLMMREPEAGISDATRALSLVKGHGKSLWRRAQAYDMKGMWKESLMDCTAFVKSLVPLGKVPYYAVSMINKQMRAAAEAGIFIGETDLREGEHSESVFRVLTTIGEESTKARRKGKRQE